MRVKERAVAWQKEFVAHRQHVTKIRHESYVQSALVCAAGSLLNRQLRKLNYTSL